MKNKPAISLVEVLVILALVAVSLVGISSANARALIAVKDNEIIDAANGLMVKTIELAKSPSVLDITDPSATGNLEGDYTFDPARPNTIVRRTTNDADLTASTTCNSSSPYYVTISNQQSNPIQACVQVSVVRRTRQLGGDFYYEITSRVLFRISSGPVLNDLVAFRRGQIT